MKHFPSVIRAFNQSKGGRFAWLYGHESMKTGEITDRQIQVGFSYLDLLGRAIEVASTIDAATVVANCPDCDDIETATKVLTFPQLNGSLKVVAASGKFSFLVLADGTILEV